MKTNGVAKAALAVGLSATALAQSCDKVLVPSYDLPVVAAGWQAQLVAGELTKPRSLQFDSSGALLVVESGKGITRHTLKDNGGTCISVSESKTLIDEKTLNHGIALSKDGKTLYASSASAVYAWDYDSEAGTVSGKREIVTNMSNNDLVTRTLLLSQKEDGYLLVSRGSADGNEVQAEDVNNGLSQIRAFDISNVTSSTKAYNYNEDGIVLGWGLRNSVGVGEHPITGGIYAVENSIDGVTRNGKDIHENNPGEELNFFGYLNGTKTANQGRNFGYPKCFAVWDVSEIPENDNLKHGSQFAITEENAQTVSGNKLTDETCASDYVAPRLTFPAHYAPLDIKFSPKGDTAYVTFRGSFDKTDPVGYRLSSIAFDPSTGDPTVSAENSREALKDIIMNKDNSVCPDKCFRPVGLAFDGEERLWMTSDSTGEIYVLLKTEENPTSTENGTIVTGTDDASPSGSATGGDEDDDSAAGRLGMGNGWLWAGVVGVAGVLALI
ncbi:soluble quino protein glucose/sorbosone dehydrogenase [Sordaria brevicollis]|uniref:Soluble quino protein glucose/sorbosone dehydrogenase n=1 Tax=Sordaria brevicollis TaxID=83679 RepID=A0AAE0PKS8_SORBR|nr:soluble quino protein glucose/sorbosone dehydrogenase [Sordaria brevicollis]